MTPLLLCSFPARPVQHKRTFRSRSRDISKSRIHAVPRTPRNHTDETRHILAIDRCGEDTRRSKKGEVNRLNRIDECLLNARVYYLVVAAAVLFDNVKSATTVEKKRCIDYCNRIVCRNVGTITNTVYYTERKYICK